jgi:DNA-binding IscR family transcriptional regulator
VTNANQAKERVLTAMQKLSRNQRNAPLEIANIAKESGFTDTIVRKMIWSLVAEGFVEIVSCTLTDDGYTKVTEYGRLPPKA